MLTGKKLFNKDIDDININDILELVENKIIENEYLEYKKNYELTNMDHKRNLLKEISAFSNKEGGLIIIGMGENKDKTPYLNGLKYSNYDELISAINSMVRSNTEPNPLPNIKIKTLDINNKKILLIKIFKSVNSPIRRIMNPDTTGDFYIRNNNLCDHMNWNELKNAFSNFTNIETKNKDFIDEKINILFSDSNYKNFMQFILFLVPVNVSNINISKEMKLVEKNYELFKSLEGTFFNNRKRVSDGYLASYKNENNEVEDYVKIYNNGIIESVLRLEKDDDIVDIDMPYYENKVLISISKYVKLYKKLQINTPIEVYLSLTNLNGFRIFEKNRFLSKSKCGFENNTLELPVSTITTENLERLAQEMKNSFDSIYYDTDYINGSKSYDENGKWIPYK
ncbi:ATP-binding protein [Methanobrevibacter sp. TMH8]|uniref:AlbA family DNA-binding domain-containing protein n=1 Tax=Methanobrevibacter sp. TMH8 TaxID=2848611 RepID=UPI001CCDA4D1|nr:ATP-binding protein [Methanobrevibacter sp. TMH8]MBZ9570940.1 ATP-binding protein [Methanobrevibacter sp. TMH8]